MNLIDFAKQNDLNVAPTVWTMPLVLSAMLLTENRITESQNGMINRLKSLRDQVIHRGIQVTGEEAIKYVEAAGRIVASLNLDQTTENPDE